MMLRFKVCLMILGLIFVCKSSFAEPRETFKIDTVATNIAGSEYHSAPYGFSGGCVWHESVVYHDPELGLVYWIGDAYYKDWPETLIVIDSNTARGSYCSVWSAWSWDHFFFAYYDSTGGNLVSSTLVRGWDYDSIKTFIVDSLGDVGKYTSITGPSYDFYPLFIAYYDVTNGDLKVAEFDGDSWATSVVDSSGDVGKYSSCKLFSDTLHISYYVATNKDLKYAKYCNNTVLEVSVVDSQGDVGMYSSIDFDEYKDSRYDGPAIAYYDATNKDLKIAGWDAAKGWQVEELDALGDVGKYCSLTLNFHGTWCGYLCNTLISYYDATNGDLKYARADRATEDWYTYKVDSVGNVGLYTKTLGNLSTYITSYYSASDSMIKVVFYGEGGAVEESRFEPNGFTCGVSPNPFREATNIRYNLDKESKVLVTICDISGRLIETLVGGKQGPGNYTLQWQPDDLPSGIYFLRLQAQDYSAPEKLVLLK